MTKKILEKTGDQVLDLALDTISIKKQAIIFANTKKSAEKCAEDLAKEIKSSSQDLNKLAEESLHSLSSPTKQCQRLAHCLKKGVAFHHAGLTAKQRDIIEENFKKGVVKIICATPTLAAGVDLPAFRTILKDLRRFGTREGLSWIPVLEYLQMCLPYEEKIVSNKGILPIGKIVEENIRCNVLSFDTGRKKFEFKAVDGYFKLKSKRLIELVTEKGYKIRVTEEHPLLVDKRWKAAKEINIGDELFLSSYVNKFSEIPSFFYFIKDKDYLYVEGMGKFINKIKEKLGLTDKRLAEILGVDKKIIYHYKNNIKNIPLQKIIKVLDLLGIEKKDDVIRKVKTRYGSFLNIPKKINEDLLWLAGIIATDGNIQQTFDRRTGSEYTRIRIFNMDKAIIDKSRSVLERLICSKAYVSKREDGLYSCEIGSTLLARIFKENFGIPFKDKTFDVEVPPFLLNSTLSLVGAYLGGVFDGDGCYTVTKDKKFKNTEHQRILFVSASKKFAEGLQELLLRMGIISRLYTENKDIKVRLKGKNVEFNKPNYYVVFNKKEYINLFGDYVRSVKCRIKAEYKKYHNLDRYHKSKESYIKLKIADKKIIDYKKIIDVYNLSVKDNNNYFASNFLVHNCGRAGRPSYDKFGEAIAIANTPGTANEIKDRYLYGEPEDILSKLAVEPVLRTYLLSLIATDFVNTKKDIVDFFSKTFWAHHFRDMERLEAIIVKMLTLLEDYGFIASTENQEFVSAADMGNEKFTATVLGKRVAELYIDPLTANFFVCCIRKALKKNNYEIFSFLQMVSHTLELRPWLRVRTSEYEDLMEKYVGYEDLVLEDEPSIYEPEYDDFTASIKTAFMFLDWVNEKNEEEILESFSVRPGELKVKLDNADWLFYAAEEIARIIKAQPLLKELAKARFRLEYGVKEELIPLLKLKGIGRVRARALFRNKLKTITDIKKADITKLVQILGKKTAIDIKKQVGIDIEAEKVPERKRKGQTSLQHYGK